MTRGRLLATGLVVASIAAVVGGVAASSEPEPAEPVGDQAKLPALARHAQRELGNHYGGVWVQGRIKLGVQAPDQRLRDRAASAAAEAGLAGRVDVVAVPRGEAELVALQDRLDAELRDVNRGADDHIDAVPDVERGLVAILTPSPADRTPAQERFLAEASQRYGETIRLERGPGPLRLETAG